jgi:hypothetical protein
MGPTPTIDGIIARGYLPKELPPAFTSRTCASVLANSSSVPPTAFTRGGQQSTCTSHNLLMRGSLRRRLGIPNPIHFFRLATFIVDNWPSLTSITLKSHMSLSGPVWQQGPRAIGRSAEDIFEDRDVRRARIRSMSRYVLKADINQFYHSIYTHSIAWAIHGKDAAKAQKGSGALLGNALDRLVRDSQDGQSTGIPIGPDTSLLIAEIILSVNDLELLRRGIKNAFRMIDDYEFGCESLSEAEYTRETLQEVLHEYQLVLNSDKTHIVELPVPIEALPISELRGYQFSVGDLVSELKQRNEIVHYFDQAFAFSREYPDDAILKYAVARLAGVWVLPANWPLYQDLLLQCVIVEPSTLEVVLNQLVQYRDSGYSLDLDHIGDVFNKIVGRHAPLGHGSEVAWVLWGSLVLGVSISDDNASKSASMNDSIVAILVLDANDKGLVSPNIDFSHFQSYMSIDELYGDQWLLAYEANIKGWLPSLDKKNHVNQDKCFAFLKKAGVYFYDDTLSGRMKYKPQQPAPEGEGY